VTREEVSSEVPRAQQRQARILLYVAARIADTMDDANECRAERNFPRLDAARGRHLAARGRTGR